MVGHPELVVALLPNLGKVLGISKCQLGTSVTNVTIGHFEVHQSGALPCCQLDSGSWLAITSCKACSFTLSLAITP